MLEGSSFRLELNIYCQLVRSRIPVAQKYLPQSFRISNPLICLSSVCFPHILDNFANYIPAVIVVILLTVLLIYPKQYSVSIIKCFTSAGVNKSVKLVSYWSCSLKPHPWCMCLQPGVWASQRLTCQARDGTGACGSTTTMTARG